MQRLRFIGKARHGAERGGAAAIVAVLLGGGVVMGFAALSIDVGSLMWERRQVQNGADAAALALAKTCVVDPLQCVVNGPDQPLLNQLNDDNNRKNASDATGGFDTTTYPDGLCGRANLLVPCVSGGDNADLKQCPTLSGTLSGNPAIPYVEVHTQTRELDNSSLMPTWLMRTLPGGSTGNTVRACARASYGAPGPTAASAPITFSMCEWRANTANGLSYYDQDPGGVPGYGGAGQPAWPSAATSPATPGGEIVITLQGGPQAPEDCANFNGHDVAGGFGYLSSSGCDTTVGVDSWVQINTGSSSPCDLSQYHGKVIFLPVFDCVMRSLSAPSGAPPTTPADVCNYGTGNNTYYHVAGWAKFYLSGYKTGGSQERASLVSGSLPCSGGDRCLSGWFLEGVLQGAPVTGPPPLPGTPGFGTYAIQAAG